MMLTWKPVIDDLRSEIERVKTSVSEATFDSDFSHKMLTAKLRINMLERRIDELVRMQEVEANALRHDINASMKMLLSETSGLRSMLGDLRLLKADRSRANYLHCLELKKNREKEGGEA